MKRFMLLVAKALGLSVLLGFSTQQILKADIKIITSNVLGESAYKKYAKCSTVALGTRLNAFKELLNFEKPDVMCLQELDRFWLDGLQAMSAFSGHQVIAEHLSLLAIVFNPARLTHLKTVHRATGPGKGIQAVTFRVNDTGQVFCVINIHAPFPKAENFQADYDFVINQFKNVPVVAMGDLNTGSSDNSVFFSRLFSSFQELAPTVGFTSRNVHTNAGEKIDYVYGQDVVASSAHTAPNCMSNVDLLLPHAPNSSFDFSDTNNHYSDHAAVVVEVSLPEVAVVAPVVPVVPVVPVAQAVTQTVIIDDSSDSEPVRKAPRRTYSSHVFTRAPSLRPGDEISLDKFNQSEMVYTSGINVIYRGGLYEQTDMSGGTLRYIEHAPARSQAATSASTTLHSTAYRHATIPGVVGWDENGFLVLEKNDGSRVRVAPDLRNQGFVYVINRTKLGQDDFGFKQGDRVPRAY